jgi:hypothetical protein
MRDLLHMKHHAERLRQMAEDLRADKYTMNPEADFAEMIGAVVQARRLREMAKAIGVSHSHLSSLGKLRRLHEVKAESEYQILYLVFGYHVHNHATKFAVVNENNVGPL